MQMLEQMLQLITLSPPFPPQDNSQSIHLVGTTLETLLKFLNWIPLGYIFETKLISSLIYKVGVFAAVFIELAIELVEHDLYLHELKFSQT